MNLIFCCLVYCDFLAQEHFDLYRWRKDFFLSKFGQFDKKDGQWFTYECEDCEEYHGGCNCYCYPYQVGPSAGKVVGD